MKSRFHRFLAVLSALILAAMIQSAQIRPGQSVFLTTASASSAYEGKPQKVEDVLSAMTVYCTHWQQLIGDPMGYTFSFDPENLKLLRDRHEDMYGKMVTTFIIDGIYADIDDNLNVFTMLFPQKTGDISETVKVLAAISALAYDFPASNAEMRERFLQILTEYNDFTERHLAELLAGDSATWTKTTEKGTFQFNFYTSNGKIQVYWVNIIDE